jgi:anti-anti-sigma factor
MSVQVSGPVADAPSNSTVSTINTMGVGKYAFWATVRPLAEPCSTAIVELHDQLDISVTERLFTMLRSVVSEEKHDGVGDSNVQHLVCDMTDVFFVDSACLPVFIEMRRQMVARGGSMRFFGASRKVARFLQITSLKTYLEEHATEAEALEAIRRRDD